MPQPLQDHVGVRFGNLVVTKWSHSLGQWICLCDCGNEHSSTATNLRSGRCQSCGCRKHTHRMTGTPEYRSWDAMKQRCLNLKATKYENYGGRGIKICDRWLESFQNFLDDMGMRPEPKRGYSLDRIDVDGDYEPDNCRWATRSEQSLNRRDHAFLALLRARGIRDVATLASVLDAHDFNKLPDKPPIPL